MIANSLRLMALAPALAGLAFAVPAAAQGIVIPETEQDSGVYVEQIGTSNQAAFDQATPDQNARAIQNGNSNTAQINQFDAGEHFASIEQDGDDNTASIAQEGNGPTGAIVSQTGDDNAVILAQRDTGAVGTLAEIVQTGAANSATLVQDGSDNQATLTQNGDNNTMTAFQLGAGNRLDWTQNGNGLPDLGITQTGNSTMFVTQSN